MSMYYVYSVLIFKNMAFLMRFYHYIVCEKLSILCEILDKPSIFAMFYTHLQ